MSERPQPGQLGEHPTQWWDTHAEGTQGRPRPGTRVLVRNRNGDVRQAGTVQYYEGIWPHQHSFPVRWDHSVHGSLCTSHEDMPLGWDYEDPEDRAAAGRRRTGQCNELAS